MVNNPLKYIDPSGETTEEPGLTPGQQVGIGGIISSIVEMLRGVDFRGFSNWIGRNFQSAIKDIVRPFREIGRFFRRLFGGKKRRRRPPQ